MSDSPPPEQLAKEAPLRKNLLHQTALALQGQFRNVIFDSDNRLHRIRFEVHPHKSTDDDGVELYGHLEFEGELDELLKTLRPIFPFEILSTTHPWNQPTVLEANLSPLVLPLGWHQLDPIPTVFRLEIVLVDPAPSIRFTIPSHRLKPTPTLEPFSNPIDSKTHTEVVFLIHGIRDRARWQSMVKRILEEIDGVVVVPIRYGYFDLFRFWLPVWTRGQPIRTTREQIQIAKNQYRDAKYSVIAHSFGTYTISQVLGDTKDLVLNRLILCGCIISNDYPWEYLTGRIAHRVINDFGTRDIWPFWARKLSWGYGDTGRYGFGRADVYDRAHDHSHGDYFDEEFIRAFWKPLFESGRIAESAWEENAPKPNRLIETISFIPLKTLILLGLLALSAWWFCRG